LAASVLGGAFGGDGAVVGASLFNGLPQRHGQTDHERRGNAGAGSKGQFVSPNQFPKR